MQTLRPTDAAQAAQAVADAAAAGTSLEVRAGGSKQAYGHPGAADAVLDVSALAGIRLYEPEELVISAGAATPLAEVEAVLAKAGQHLAFEPPNYGAILGPRDAAATLGGILACNLSGPRRIAAGAARDHFLGVSAISGTGEPFKSGGRVVKNVTGYDLSKLMAGSLGTLGVMTEVSLKVLPAPPDTRTVLVLGLDATAAVEMLGKAAGSQVEATGLAHLPDAAGARSSVAAVSGAGGPATAIRLEGPGPSVAARGAALVVGLAPNQIQELDRDASRVLWREIRDGALVPSDGPLWRLSVPPADGAGVAQRIGEVCDCQILFDWAGGLLWVALAGEDPRAGDVRGALGEYSGHATLVRASVAARRSHPVFQPQPGPLAALSARVKLAFDPLGILNPGRMGMGL